jgi:hypothetical protein
MSSKPIYVGKFASRSRILNSTAEQASSSAVSTNSNEQTKLDKHGNQSTFNSQELND